MSGFIHPSRMNMNPAFSSSKGVVMHDVLLTFNEQGDATFDFGSGQPLPPSRYPVKEEEFDEHPQFSGTGHGSSPFRSFGKSADIQLLDYLRDRRTSPYFLQEIDMFLAAHPEIAQHRPQFVEQINNVSPLNAYKFFIRGYTRPARYMDGVLPPNIYEIPLPDTLTPIASIRDEELVDFFGEFAYRVDILQNIDAEVARLVVDLRARRRISFAQRKLVVYTVYGNVVDAFKFYEYNYQEEWLAHRYLPEHVVLSELPKPAIVPRAHKIAQPDEFAEERRSHLGTRARMADANDAGVDVIDVLLDDFTGALCRQGLRRVEIEQMRREAVRNIDHQRRTSGGRDIVDMVMDRAHQTTPAHFNRNPGPRELARTSKTQKLARNLRRLLLQETELYEEGLSLGQSMTRMRQHVERELVATVVSMAYRDRRMTHGEQQRWMSMFSWREQKRREANGRRIDIFTELDRFM